jgi:hypothetical protein
MSEMQRFRGRIYHSDGALQASQLKDGRHQEASDESSWHLLLVDGNDAINGCALYRSYDGCIGFNDLRLSGSELANNSIWRGRLAKAVRREFGEADKRNVAVAELGGWAISEELRCRIEAVRLALSTFSLARMLGGCVGLTTATVRHGSSTILRKLGGKSLMVDGETIPKYFDSRYNCDMEVLRFDSSEPSPNYEASIQALADGLNTCEIICLQDNIREQNVHRTVAPDDRWRLDNLRANRRPVDHAIDRSVAGKLSTHQDTTTGSGPSSSRTSRAGCTRPDGCLRCDDDAPGN